MAAGCRGFSVESPQGPIGALEDVLLSEDGRHVIALVVRLSPARRHTQVVTLPLKDVVAVARRAKRIVVRQSAAISVRRS